jgi:hypothetical protein
MFLPMHSIGGGGFSVDVDLWGTSFSGGGQSDSSDWYDDGIEGEDGVGELRAAGPLMIVATVMAFAAITASLLTAGQRSNLLPFALMATSSLFVILSLVLYESGINANNSQMSHTYGFAIIVAAIATAALATVMLIVPNTSNGSATAE